MKLKRGKEVVEVKNPIQIKAFKASGWVETTDKAKKEE